MPTAHTNQSASSSQSTSIVSMIFLRTACVKRAKCRCPPHRPVATWPSGVAAIRVNAGGARDPRMRCRITNRIRVPFARLTCGREVGPGFTCRACQAAVSGLAAASVHCGVHTTFARTPAPEGLAKIIVDYNAKVAIIRRDLN